MLYVILVWRGCYFFWCSHKTFVAIAEGRGLAKGEIGLACLDLKGSEIILSQVILLYFVSS